MAKHLQRAKVDERQSVFPAAEPASFCSRPTPVVPANPDLGEDEPSEHESNMPEPPARASVSSVRPSDRPTFVPDDYVEPRLESPPSVTIDGITPLDGADEAAPAESPAHVGLAAAGEHPAPLLVPPITTALTRSDETTAPPRASRGRLAFARVLFILLFGSVGTLLGYAFKPQVAAALEQMRGASSARNIAK
jgi:hypothetical protein